MNKLKLGQCGNRGWWVINAATSLTLVLIYTGHSAQAAPLSLATAPLIDKANAAPLNMLILGRDHKLFMAAYNDATDLNGDGVLDIGYKGYLSSGSGGIDYFGYFDSFKCYTYSGGVFTPASVTADKTCSGQWSGDFLNYVTTSRIDALRKVLYGGYRSTDTTSSTILERAYIPQDAHSWGKEYQSTTRDGYNISKYTPYSAPSSGKYILFANTTPTSSLNSGNATNPSGANGALPLLRVMNNTTHRIWEWVSKESPVAGTTCSTTSTSSAACDIAPVDYTVRVQVCNSSLLEGNCEQYPNSGSPIYKPVGLLHQYGETNQMYFGLLSGSYTHNFQGGVVRKEVTSFTDELDLNTGIFASPKKGLIASLDGFKIEDSTSYNASYVHNHNCANYWDQNQLDGNCEIWGNPIGEMMYESLRYFSGVSTPTSGYSYTLGSSTDDDLLNLPEDTAWKDPYKSVANGGQGYPICAKPFDTVISDVNPSRDSELPGSPFSGAPAATTINSNTFNVSTLGQTIWNNEFGVGAKNIFIGEVGATADSMPSVKSASSFGNIRGLSPEEPTRQGTYYSASVAYFAHTKDINGATGNQLLNTYAVALSSPIPRMEIPVAGKTITLVPIGKVICGAVACDVVGPTGTWNPTEQIVAFYVDTMANMPGQPVDMSTNGGLPYMKFRINFEDAEQGNDYDMDEIVSYALTVKSNGTLDVQLKTEYASAGDESHIGYVISGTNGRDGVYLEVEGGGGGTNHYKFDTPPFTSPVKWAGDCLSMPVSCKSAAAQLPGPAGASPVPAVTTPPPPRNFTPGNSPPATLLRDPLWYAAKYGGFNDINGDQLPQSGEWDANSSGTPDNYFLVTNALTLGTQMGTAFDAIIQHQSSASSAAVNGSSITSGSRVYQASFHSGDWLGHLYSYTVNTDGTLHSPAEWDAATKLPTASLRNIYTTNSSGTATTFTWAGLDSTRQAQLSSTPATGAKMLDYLRGDGTNEISNGGPFRNRATKLGDIVDSSPVFISQPRNLYSDVLESQAYSTFRINNLNRQGMIYAGANDGMLHAFNGTTGVEQFAYVPSSVFGNLKLLTNQSYSHRYYVDGSPAVSDAFFGSSWKTVLVGGLNGGGQGFYALDVTNPTAFSASKVLWEFTDRSANGDKDLGYTFSQPSIIRLHNGKWAALFGNGYNNTEADGSASTTGHAVLFLVDVSNGSLIRKIDTMAGTATTPNGLATPIPIDIDGDGIADYVYAGDLLGNMWKFDITNSSAANWSIPYTSGGTPVPLYIAKDASGHIQPITARPDVSRGAKNIGLMVFFGTGKWLEDPADRLDNATTIAANQRPQTFYGIYDPNTGATDAFTGRSNLAPQSILAETTVGSTAVRVTSNNSVGTRGWYIDLISPNVGYQGERMVANPVARDGRIIFTTLIPQTDPCVFGGDSWIMELDGLTGQRLAQSPIDVNHDGVINASDYVTVTVAGVAITVPVSGQKSGVGIVNGLAIATELSGGGGDGGGSGQCYERKVYAGAGTNLSSGAIDNMGEIKERAKCTGNQSWHQLK